MTISYEGTNSEHLRRILSSRVDDNGCPVESFVDVDGGWPLRCCLADSQPGDELAIIASSNFPWNSPYRVTGPIVVHTADCPGNPGTFPRQFDQRAQIVRAYGSDKHRTNTSCTT